MRTQSPFQKGDIVKSTKPLATYKTPTRSQIFSGAKGTVVAIWTSETEQPLHLVLYEFESGDALALAQPDDLVLLHREVPLNSTIDASHIENITYPTIRLHRRHRLESVIKGFGLQIENQNAYILFSIETTCINLLNNRRPDHLNAIEQEFLRLLESLQGQNHEQAIFIFEPYPA